MNPQHNVATDAEGMIGTLDLERFTALMDKDAFLKLVVVDVSKLRQGTVTKGARVPQFVV